jgi:hypothetical protein
MRMLVPGDERVQRLSDSYHRSGDVIDRRRLDRPGGTLFADWLTVCAAKHHATAG